MQNDRILRPRPILAGMKFIKKLFRFIVPILIIGAGIVGFGLLKVDDVEQTPELRQQQSWLVDAQQVSKSVIIPTVELFGRTTASSQSTLSSILDGKVIEVNVLIGNQVNEADVLVRLDSRTIETLVRQSQADVDRARASMEREIQRQVADTEILYHEQRLLQLSIDSLQRAQTLKSRNLISQAQFDASEIAQQQAHLAVTARQAALREFDSRLAVLQAELKRAQATLNKAMQDLDDTMITAPYSGWITAIHVDVGSHVRNGSPVIEMFDPTTTEIRTLIPNRFLDKIRRTMASGIVMEATALFDGMKVPLHLDRLAAAVQSGTGGIDAFFRPSSNSDYPELGRSVTIDLALAPIDNAIALPYQAVYGSNHVFKIESDQLKRVQITRHGQTMRGDVAMIVATSEQLADGDLVLITQLSNANDGLGVTVSNLQ